ncbi:MAG: CDP-alcohol phosphatidyltransferase family protein [Phycisphaerae bacterium]|nr:CDP-alcohol phosphatidyltransferase family protein [Phycisphaerae bacterium]
MTSESMEESFGKHDFEALHKTGERAGTSWAIGYAFARARDQIALGLVWLGATPNGITLTGLLLTTAAAVCFAIGGSHTAGHVQGLPSSRWGLLAFCLLFVAGACDMLDGAVSRAGKMASRFGQVFDSTLDRFSDCVLCLGLIVHFAWIGNVTLSVLSGLAMLSAYSVSYVKARVDCIIHAGTVGWWQRPERSFGFLVAALFGHLPAFIWQQATMPFFTVALRIRHAAAAMEAEKTGTQPRTAGPMPGLWRYIAIWRHARGSLAYDIAAAINIGWIIVAPWIWPFFYGRSDPLRSLLDRWVGQ